MNSNTHGNPTSVMSSILELENDWLRTLAESQPRVGICWRARFQRKA